MLYVAAFISTIFLAIGFLLNTGNARYLLSGYNMLSAEDRQKVDIEGYLKYFRRFHIILALSTFGGTMLLSFLDQNIASMFMTVFPLLAYIVFVIRSSRYSTGLSKPKVTKYFPVFILVFAVILVIGFTFNDYRSSEIVLNKQSLQIKGSFGIEILKKNIDSVALIPEYPAISWKSYGFAAGDYAKGDFRLKNGGSAKMYINKEIKPTIFLKADGNNIYYNSDQHDMDSLYREILKWKGE